MKKFVHAASIAALSAASLAPAMAQDEALQDLTAAAAPAPADEFVDPYPELSAMCAEIQKPNTNSGFSSVAINVLEGQTSTSEVDDPNGIATTVGNGTPTIAKTFENAHVNGKSVNIHADITEIATFATSTTTIPTLVTTTVSTSFDCHVHKMVNGMGTGDDAFHPGFNEAPQGLQRGLSVETSSSTLPGSRQEPGPSPFVVMLMDGEEGVICISPTKNPGTWRNANGYKGNLGTCSRAWHDSLGLSQPTASIPAV